ncbi:MAG: response regulator [Anaerolineae bacterium]
MLLVDDEPDNLGVVQTVLRFYGAQVYTAANGELGLKALEEITPTLILLDLSMPIMDGWEMLKQLKQIPKMVSVPVIALTAHAMPEDVERVKEAGFDAYIPKPLRLATFLLEIQNCLQSRKFKTVEAVQETQTALQPETKEEKIIEVVQEVKSVLQPEAKEVKNEYQSVESSRS